MQLTTQDINHFLESRPAISKSAFCREAGISYQLVDYILTGKRSLTNETIKKLLPVMKKYGWGLTEKGEKAPIGFYV